MKQKQIKAGGGGSGTGAYVEVQRQPRLVGCRACVRPRLPGRGSRLGAVGLCLAADAAWPADINSGGGARGW